MDRELFSLGRRDEGLRKFLDGSSSGGGARTLMLYACLVSREKGLERLAAGYMDLRRRRDDVHLVIAGDGPYRGELEAMLGDTAAFTGFLRGEELARTFASCDVFVFPSSTDTLGRWPRRRLRSSRPWFAGRRPPRVHPAWSLGLRDGPRG